MSANAVVTPEATEPGTRYEHLYVHVPFCGRRCSYCDFSIAVRREVPVSEYNDAIMAELVTRRIGPLPAVSTLYFGGGTPSKLGGPGLAELIHRIGEGLGVGNFSTSRGEVEITVEANPEDIEVRAVEEWVRAGVNRVSLGVQSFDSDVLAWMHRGHSPESVSATVQVLRGSGIANVSVDLIFALPSELRRDWARDLDLALSLDPTHLSLYGLTVESHTPLGRWAARGQVREADEDRYAEEFLLANRVMAGAGFEHYEVSNFGRPGFRSRHNSSYWKWVPYLGLGPAAHGFDGRERRWNTRAYAEWLSQTREPRDPVEGREVIGAAEAAAEEVYLGLRTIDGLRVRQDELKTVTAWVEQGWGTLSADRLRLSPQGWLRLDALAAALTSLRSPS